MEKKMKKSKKEEHSPLYESGKLYRFFLYFVLVLFALSVLIPLFFVLMSSFKENKEFYENPWKLPMGFYLENFQNAWSKAKMGEYLKNSVMVTALAILLLLVLALPCAYALARCDFKIKKWAKGFFMAGLFINLGSIAVPIFLLLRDMDQFLSEMGRNGFFQNNLFILALVYASTALPFTVYLLSSYFVTLPRDFEEASSIDGAGRLRTMVQIMFPMAKPAIVTVILFNFLSFWNEYILSLLLLSDPEGPKTLPVGLMNLMQGQQAKAEYGMMYAGLVMVMLPTLFLYIFVNRKLTESMTVGGVKG